MEIDQLRLKGPIIELLEPAARSYNNVPQTEKTRENCYNDGSQAHYLTTQNSMNFFQWRIKRPSPVGNCTIRVSVDGSNFHPLMP